MKTKTIKKVLDCKDNFSFVSKITSEMAGRALVDQEEPTRMVLEWARRDGVTITARLSTHYSDVLGNAEIVKLRIGSFGYENIFFHEGVRDNVARYRGRVPDIHLFGTFAQCISDSLFMLSRRHYDAN